MNDPDEQVRRLLASARTDEPVPPQVAARLDDVLAGLVAEHTERHRVPSLAGRRRRRTVSWAVAAAAAVVVGGVAIGQVVQTGDDSLSAGDSAGQVTDDSGAAASREEESGPGMLSESDSGADSLPEPSRSGPAPAEAGLGVLSAATFESDVVALRALGPAPDTGSKLAGLGCLPPDPRPGDEVFEVVYEGEPGALVLRPVREAGQRALLYLCGDRAPTRSALVPAP